MYFSFSTLNYDIDLLYQKIHFYSIVDFFDPASADNNVAAPDKSEYSLPSVEVNSFKVGSHSVRKFTLAVDYLELFSCCRCLNMGNDCC